MPHAIDCGADPRPLEDLLARNNAHRERQLRQAQRIGQAFVQRHDDMRLVRKVVRAFDVERHTQMIEQRAPKTTLHQRTSFAIEVFGRLGELTQARNQQPPAGCREQCAFPELFRPQRDRRSARPQASRAGSHVSATGLVHRGESRFRCGRYERTLRGCN